MEDEGVIGACMLLWVMRKGGCEVKSAKGRLQEGKLL